MTAALSRATAQWTQTLHLARLWLQMEHRARTTRIHGALATTMPGMALTPGRGVDAARIALIYRPNHPYALTLWVSVTDQTFTATIARDLIAQALTRGSSGYHEGVPGPVHVTVINHQWTGVSIDTLDHARIAITLPTRPLRRAARTWYTKVPRGTEHVDTASVEAHLAQAA